MPGVIRANDNKLIAKPDGNRSMEIDDEADPALIAFSSMSICLSRISSCKPTSINVEAMIRLPGKRRMKWFPLLIGISTVLFFGLFQIFNTLPWSSALIAGYAALMIGAMASFTVLNLFHKTTVVYSLRWHLLVS